MQSYAAARTTFSIGSFLAWSAIILGIIIMVIAVSTISQFASRNPMALFGAVIPGLVITVAGFCLLVFVQFSRATVDSAEYAQQSLKVARDQLDFAKRVHLETQKLATQSSGSTATQQAFAAEPTQKDDSFTHNGKIITKRTDGTYLFAGFPFATLDEAKAHIDSLLVQGTASDPAPHTT